MFFAFFKVPVVLLVTSPAVRALLRETSEGRLTSYSFDQYLRDYSVEYTQGTEEYGRRSKLFQGSLEGIHARNMQNERQGSLWVAGIHPFMHWSKEERSVLSRGYIRPSSRGGAAGVSSLQLKLRGSQGLDARVNQSILASSSGGLGIDAGPAVRNQGNCGSCWAISATTALEAQLQRSGFADKSVLLAAQEFVDCVPNPQHCGGTGGCGGATGELAYAYARDHGMALESDLPYNAHTNSCGSNNPKRVTVSGWSQIPSNRVESLKTSLVENGPTVVAVNGDDWMDYEKGIFDNCQKDTILGHAVLAKGFGEDAGNKFWLIQNSWGSDWGEQGHIRLLRHDSDLDWCGIDSKPSEGLGCDGGPSQVTVCGMCGLLYDPIVPQGVRLEHDAAGLTPGVNTVQDDVSQKQPLPQEAHGDMQTMDAFISTLDLKP